MSTTTTTTKYELVIQSLFKYYHYELHDQGYSTIMTRECLVHLSDTLRTVHYFVALATSYCCFAHMILTCMIQLLIG